MTMRVHVCMYYECMYVFKYVCLLCYVYNMYVSNFELKKNYSALEY